MNSFEVFLGHDERVTDRYWIFVENRDELVVFIDYVGWSCSLNDIAKDAIQVGDRSFNQSNIELRSLSVNDFDDS